MQYSFRVTQRFKRVQDRYNFSVPNVILRLLGRQPCRKINEIPLPSLPWAQEVPGSNPGAPTNSFLQ